MKHLLFMISTLLLLGGCQTAKTTNLKPVDLYGSYQLVEFDAKKLTSEQQELPINFEPAAGNNLKVNGALCNVFMGEATLANGILTSEKGLASTRMSCFREQEAAMENALAKMMAAGAKLKLQGSELELQGAGHKFVYKKQ